MKILYVLKMFFLVVYPLFIVGETEVMKENEGLSPRLIILVSYILYFYFIFTSQG